MTPDSTQSHQTRHLAGIHRRLAWLVEKPSGVLLLKSTEHHGLLILKDDTQIRLHFVDRWRTADRPALLQRLAEGKNVNLSGIMSRIDLNDPLNLLGVYTQAMMLCLAWAPNPGRVYMLGFGGGRIPLIFRHYFPETIIDGAELDAELIDIARDYFGYAFDDHTRIAIGDGRQHLAKMPPGAPCDILLIDCYSGAGRHPVDLATPDFYSLCKSRLTPTGVVASNLIESDPRYPEKLKWFCESFRHVLDFEHDHAHVLFGSDGPPLTPEQLLARAQGIQAQHNFHFHLPDRARQTDPARQPRPSPAPPPRQATPPGRNDPCPCGSGKKYKKCCMANPFTPPRPSV